MDNKDSEHLRDLKERDEFAERLRAKDEVKRKMDARVDKTAVAKRFKLERKNAKDISLLREQSRQKYIKIREQDVLSGLKDEIIDEERLFKNVELTEFERVRTDHKKKTLAIANKYKEADQLEKVDRYFMPDVKSSDRKHADKFAEEKKDNDPGFETRKWEDEHVSQALMSFGARDAKEKLAKNKDYDYLLDDEIDFVKSLSIPGKNEPEDKDFDANLQQAKSERAKKTMQEVRCSLPIYAYRNALLDAIRDHQVIVVEGETGSGKTTQIPQYLFEDGYTCIGLFF
jgi:pre-mRNA-splicing factor ATP-dependent RNA helicase DHX16